MDPKHGNHHWLGSLLLLLAGALALALALPGNAPLSGLTPLQGTAALLTSACILLLPDMHHIRHPLGLSLLGGSGTLLLLVWISPMAMFSPVTLKLSVGVAAILFALNGINRLLARAGMTPAAAAWWVMLGTFLSATSPLWLAPLLDQLQIARPLIDLLIGLNPLTWLAVLAEQDYLRSEWFYRNSPLGGMRYDYPTPLGIFLGCLVIGGLSFVRPPQRLIDNPRT